MAALWDPTVRTHFISLAFAGLCRTSVRPCPELRHEDVCFVPSVSAVAVRDIDRQENLCRSIGEADAEESALDSFVCSTTTTAHTAITEQLCTWIMDQVHSCTPERASGLPTALGEVGHTA
ncbi:hypothetical protein KME66_32170 [Streptomyces sp. YPW6]|uniref:hypothetical protein n=1 Tax=Streptomyces sp. YPW6 TaxID=2840373 RepID=UPI001C0A982B|nr:hypothetical protein [Streptomyces sp. YPW6]QWQ45119.1 hypothetical protein KME66_32170 [Streptomyces sp. YPW6]